MGNAEYMGSLDLSPGGRRTTRGSLEISNI